MGDKKPRKAKGLPLIMRLPPGLREQPAWIFIGILIGFTGLSYVSGFTESSVADLVGRTGMRVWGAFLTFAGFGVVVATLKGAPALEKLALRVMSICLTVYALWLATAVDVRRLVMTAVLVGILVLLAEIRIAVLKMLFRQGPWL